MPDTHSDPIDFLIITALEHEAQAIISRLTDHQIKRFEDRNIRTYHCGTVPIERTDRSYRVVVVLLPNMGELSAANATTDALNDWHPQHVIMIGIAGGIAQDDLDLGDVVVADQVVGYDYGKQYNEGLKPRDHVYPCSALLLERVRNFALEGDAWSQHIDVLRPATAPRDRPKRFVGPIASGNKVIASKDFQAQLKTRWPKLIAIETEAEGVFAAVFDRPMIKHMLVIRGISDLADKAKDDVWQLYAANAAAAYAIALLKSGPVNVGASHASPASVAPIKISTAKLPSTAPDLFGREKELALLDVAWADPHTHIVSLVAWGGVGKSALVNGWLNRLAADRDAYRGATHVYGWSFYSQGAAEGRQASADQFIAEALKWFGDPQLAESSESSWNKGEHLAELIGQSRTLLILDGFEPLQSPHENGRITDKTSGMVSLLRELARHNPGLVVITTRLQLDDLKDFRTGAATQIDLEALSDTAGAAYLKHLEVVGTDAERQQAAHEYKGHALALTLLGRYLVDVYDGDIRKRDLIPALIDEEEQGAHAKRIMIAYEKWFAGRPEQNILSILGLFDRPVDKGTLESIKVAPVIVGLTDHLQGLPLEKWQLALKHLRQARLLAEKDPHVPDTLDCHPLLREHFGSQLHMTNPKAWRIAHRRLYEYYRAVSRRLPDTLEEMAPLFAAVVHGCLAEHYEEAFSEYYERIQRDAATNYCVKKLGAVSADLASLAGFFEMPWIRPVTKLRKDIAAAILGIAGFRLRALGRLTEAVESTKASLTEKIANNAWKSSSGEAGNLSELYLTLGDVPQALTYAQQGMELADRSGELYRQSVNRATLANALHQAGRLPDAAALFREAEEIQKQHQPEFPLLYSARGFHYCDLLLSQGQIQDVLGRATQTLEWTGKYFQSGGSLLDIALDNLSLGRALTPAPSPTLPRETGESARNVGGGSGLSYLQRVVDGLRQAGTQDYLPLGLLARAEYFRLTGDTAKAQIDLDEAFTIATRGGMRLHEADCHLGYARLALAQGNKDEARQHLSAASVLIDQCGYHRRDGEVQELESALASA